MKLHKKQPEVKRLTAVSSALPMHPGCVMIQHHQTMKQSMHYQSLECGYSVSALCEDNPNAVKKRIAGLERLVEDFLTAKFRQHRKVLQNLSTETRVDS